MSRWSFALLAGLVLVLGLQTPACAADMRGVATILPYPYTLRSNLRLTQVAGQPLTRRLDFANANAQSTLRVYDTDMTKKLHLIVISDDFTAFLHVHPMLGDDGHFRLTLRFPRRARYHLYADAVAHGLGRTVFRYDVDLGAGKTNPVAERARSEATVGPYRVHLDRLTIYAGSLSMLSVAISKHGQPASDLHPYLGADAHAVLIAERDLAYVHAHAMSMKMMMKLASLDDCEQQTILARMNLLTLAPDAVVPDEMMVHLRPPRRGHYKLWVQFNGGGHIYAAPFLLTAI